MQFANKNVVQQFYNVISNKLGKFFQYVTLVHTFVLLVKHTNKGQYTCVFFTSL